MSVRRRRILRIGAAVSIPLLIGGCGGTPTQPVSPTITVTATVTTTMPVTTAIPVPTTATVVLTQTVVSTVTVQAADTSGTESVAAPPPPPLAATSAPGCHPLTNGGKCYEPGELCRTADHGVTGVAGDGESITCQNNNGWRWELA